MNNLQTIFNEAVSKTLAQNQKSLVNDDVDSNDASRCAYRGKNNLKCAAGHLIPDSLYQEYIEGNSLWIEEDGMASTSARFFMKKLGYTNEEVLFIAELQSIHDGYKVSEWKEQFIRIGRAYNLDTKFLNSN